LKCHEFRFYLSFIIISQNPPRNHKKIPPNARHVLRPRRRHLPAQGAVKVHHDLFNHQSGGVRFTRGRKQIALVSTHQPEQAALTALVAAHGVRGLVWIPLAVDEECARLHHRYQAFLDDRAQHIRQLAEERTGDAELQERIAQSVLERIEANPR